MTFTQQLYQSVCDVLPGMTSRNFSRLCGKSEGYFGSICAQNLSISTNSLIFMAEMLEYYICEGYYTDRVRLKLRNVQRSIAEEIARRTHDLSIDNLPVRKMILSAVASAAYARDQHCSMPSIILG